MQKLLSVFPHVTHCIGPFYTCLSTLTTLPLPSFGYWSPSSSPTLRLTIPMPYWPTPISLSTSTEKNAGLARTNYFMNVPTSQEYVLDMITRNTLFGINKRCACRIYEAYIGLWYKTYVVAHFLNGGYSYIPQIHKWAFHISLSSFHIFCDITATDRINR